MGFGGMGSIGGIVGAGLNYEANSRDTHDQQRANARYQNAYRQLSDLDTLQQNQLAGQLGGYATQRYGAADQLAQALGGDARLSAGQNMANDYLGRTAQTMYGVDQQTGLRANGTPNGVASRWNNLAMGQYQPALQARVGLIGAQGAQAGYTNYDTNALANYRASDADIARQAQQAQDFSNVMQQRRNKMLADASLQYQYQGPRQSVQNLRALGSVASAI